MRKLTYLAVLEPRESGGYGVYFPDLPGCISEGNDIFDASQNATDALGLHIYGMEQDGDELPEPSAAPQIDPETAPGYLIMPVSVFPSIVAAELNARRVKTSVTILAPLKEAAEREGLNISKIAEAALIEKLGIDSPHRFAR